MNKSRITDPLFDVSKLNIIRYFAQLTKSPCVSYLILSNKVYLSQERNAPP